MVPSELPVGENPTELEIRKLARELVSEWMPNGIERERYVNHWGLGTLGGIFPPDENDKDVVAWFWICSANRRGMGTQTPITSIKQLRAAAISLLVYCEVEDMRQEIENA